MVSKKSKIKHHVDVRSGADILGLNELLKKKKNNTIIVLIYADFCGHCTTFKNDVWSKLALMPNRNAGLASIHHDQVQNTPFAAKTINGYPTVFKLKKGQTPEQAEELNDIRNMETMNAIAEGEAEDPQEEAENPEEEAQEAQEVEEKAELLDNLSNNSIPLNSSSEKLRNSIKKKNISSLLSQKNGSKSINMPNFKSDMLNSQIKMDPTLEFKSTETKKLQNETVGGSLYASLLEASKVVAPAALLTGAVVLSKKRKHRKTKKVSKKSKRKTRVKRS
jgi:hypothetical protein